MLKDRYYIKETTTELLLSSYDYKSGFFTNLKWTADEYGAISWSDRIHCGNICGAMISQGFKVTFINRPQEIPNENVNNPAHYGGADNPYEAIKVIDAWQLDFCLGNAVKYISRAGKKDPAKEREDLEKAAWYLKHKIDQLPQ